MYVAVVLHAMVCLACKCYELGPCVTLNTGFETSSYPLGVLQVVMFFTVLLVPLTLHGALSTSWAHAVWCFWPVSAPRIVSAARTASMLTTGYKAAGLLQLTHVALCSLLEHQYTWHCVQLCMPAWLCTAVAKEWLSAGAPLACVTVGVVLPGCP